jgi:hypothetical protein
MATLNIEDYTVDISEHNATVYYNYLGKDKDGNSKPAQKLIGYYSPLSRGCVQAFEAIIKHGLSQQGEMSMKEFIDFQKVNKSDIEKFVKEAWSK